jgi:hypothetical protein
MTRRKQCRPILDAEIERWSAMGWEQLVSELADVQTYEIAWESKQYQVEVILLENTAEYVHASVQ